MIKIYKTQITIKIKIIISFIVVILVLISAFSYKYLYEKGLLLPKYFEWKEKQIELSYFDNIYDDKYNAKLENQNRYNEFSAKEFNYPISKLSLKNKSFVAYSNQDVVFKTEDDYKVQDFLFEDVDNDGNDEIILLLWKRGRFGKFLPFFIEKNDESWDQHIFIFDIKNNQIKPKWCSSYIEADVKELLFDKRKIFTIISKDGGRTRYKWLSWGLQNIKASKFDYDEKNDKILSEAHIKAVGDNLINKTIIDYGENNGGNYDFIYENIKKCFNDADINIINNETMLELDNYSGFPKFRTPIKVGEAVVNAGFNVIALANNHSLDTNTGLKTTYDFYKKNNIDVIGVQYDNNDDYIIKEINGIKIGIINLTEFINNMSAIDIANSNVNNLINEKKVRNNLDNMVRKSDCSIVVVHWGNENTEEITKKQKYWCDIFLQKGIDIVIGSHTHILQKNELYNDDMGNELMVYYSLGNFISNQTNIKSIIGAILNIDIAKTNNGIKFKNIDLTGIITHKENNFATIYELDKYNETLSKKHSQKIVLDKIKNDFDIYIKNNISLKNANEILTKNSDDNVKLSDNAIAVKKNILEKIKNAKTVRDYVDNKVEGYTLIDFGKYNGKTVKWRLLDIKNNIAYLECENVIDKTIFDTGTPNNFRESQIHNYLNTKLIVKMFNKNEAEYVSTFGITLDCTYRFENLKFDINDKNFLMCADGDYWLLNVCNEGENTSNISMGKYVDSVGNIINGAFNEEHGIRPFLKIPIK